MYITFSTYIRIRTVLFMFTQTNSCVEQCVAYYQDEGIQYSPDKPASPARQRELLRRRPVYPMSRGQHLRPVRVPPRQRQPVAASYDVERMTYSERHRPARSSNDYSY